MLHRLFTRAGGATASAASSTFLRRGRTLAIGASAVAFSSAALYVASSSSSSSSIAYAATSANAPPSSSTTLSTPTGVNSEEVASASTDSDSEEDTSASSSTYPVNIDVTRLIPDRPSNLIVRSVVLVTRHGSRTPITLLPGQSREEFVDLWGECPLGDHKTIPCGRGLLTHFGEFQLASVGYHLRQRYVHSDGFLPSSFDPSFFRFRSTDLPRTELSLARMVQSLYPGLELSQLKPLIEKRKQVNETMYPNHYHCPRLKELYVQSCHASYHDSPDEYPGAAEYKRIADSPEAIKLREKFATAMKTPAAELGTWVVIGDELKCRQAVGMPQVAGITQKDADDANVLAEKTFQHILRAGESEEHDTRKPACKNSPDLLYTDKSPKAREVVRLGMGRMVQEFFEQLDDVKKECEKEPAAASASTSSPSSSSPSSSSSSSSSSSASSPSNVPRMFFYSGHDTTIAPLLNALHAGHALGRPGITHVGWPVLAGNMMIELLEKVPAAEEQNQQQRHHPIGTSESFERSTEQSFAPIPPPATDDEEHHLPKQKDDAKSSKAAVKSTPRAKSSPVPSGSSISPRAPLIASPQSRWFLRLLVDHKEVSIIEYDEYKHIRESYRVKNWTEECKQKSTQPIPTHVW